MCHSNYDTLKSVHSSETKAVTITIPQALYDAVEKLARERHCGNVSAVIRNALYKEASRDGDLELKEGDKISIDRAEKRSGTYRPRRPRQQSSSKADAGAANLLWKHKPSSGKNPGAK